MLRSTVFTLVMLLLVRRAESLNMTVQVTVIPKTKLLLGLPLCSLPLLELFQPLLSHWVIQATLPNITDFAMPAGLTLMYRRPSRRMMLRAAQTVNNEDDDGDDETNSRLLTTRAKAPAPTKAPVTTRTSAYPASCYTCNSAGCAQYCGKAVCTLCASSRRRRLTATERVSNDNSTKTVSTSSSQSTQQQQQLRENFELDEDDLEMSEEERQLALIDFVALGVQVSGIVQALARNFLLSQVLDVLGCLGDPSYLNTTVTYLVNQ